MDLWGGIWASQPEFGPRSWGRGTDGGEGEEEEEEGEISAYVKAWVIGPFGAAAQKESTGKRDVIEKGRKEKKVKTREKKNGGR